jgi:two-component system NtrC family sensor kinase
MVESEPSPKPSFPPRLDAERLLRALRFASLAAPVLVFAIVARISYLNAFADAELRARHLSAMLQEHAQKVFETVGLALRQVDQRLKGVDWDTIRRSRALWEELGSLQRSSEQFGSFFVIDSEGKTALTTRVFPNPTVDFSDRDYFTVQRERDAGLYLGRAYTGRISDVSIFNFSIRRTSPDGAFNGVIGSSAYVEYFLNFYRAVGDPSDRFAVALLREDGNVLVRYPSAGIGRTVDLSETLEKARRGGVGTFYARSAIDGKNRLTAFARVHQFPAYVLYSIDADTILAAWFNDLLWSAALALAFGGVMFWLSSSALRHARLETAALRRVQETSESLRREIRRREQAEASLLQAQKLDAVGRLTGGIAHDFNNLLQIITGNLAIAGRRPDGARLERALAAAQYAAERGADLTRSLLAFSRQQSLHAEVVDLNAVLQKTRSWIGRTISDAIEIRYDCEKDIWPVRLDIAQFDAALLNLVVNARDAMPDGGILDITCRSVVLNEAQAAECDVAPGRYVQIAVADSGTGIPPDVLERVYDPFFTTKDVGKGSGLGLSQVYGFVRQSGGGISIDSKVGRGTRVSLYLPACDALPTRSEVSAAAAPTAVKDRGKVVLVVEDEDEVRRLAIAMLDDLGFTTITARSGKEALALVAAGEPIDILLSDLFMPRGTGAELAEQAMALRPSLKVLLATASIDAVTSFPLLRKPYTAAALGEKLKQL